MKIVDIALREIKHRKFSFIITVIAILCATFLLVFEINTIKCFDNQTEKIIKKKEEELKKRIAKLNDDMRKIMKGLGFNIIIIPKDQNLHEFYSKGYASKLMPEDYVKKLSESRILTIRHLLPILERVVKWKEQGDRKIRLFGTIGEVRFKYRKPKEPMMLPVPKGKIVIGYELWKSLNLKPGSKIKFLGKEFEVYKCNPEKATKDDITIWMNLYDAQEILGLKGKINAIYALECNCHGGVLEDIRKDITNILPDTQVKELRTKALARAEARKRVREEGRLAILREKAMRMEVKQRMENFAGIIIPAVFLASAALIGFLAFINVRSRKKEIGILISLGFSSGKIFNLIILRPLIGGVVGGILGYLIASIVLYISKRPDYPLELFDPVLFVICFIGAPLLSVLSSLPPSISAVSVEPALILKESRE